MLSLLPLLLLQGEMPVAVLQSGARVEAKETPAVGDRRVETAFGRYDASLDPVVEVVDGRTDLQLLEPLAEMDRTAWLARVSERGLLSTLVDATPEDAATRAAWLDALTAWGGKLDTLPSRTKRDQRSERLWQALLRAEDAEQALLTGALLREIPESRDLPKRRIGLVDLRRALESKDREVRRAAALIAAHQRTHDLLRPLLDRSLEDEGDAVRTAAAEALVSLDEEKALGLWTLSLWRSKAGDLREQAADHLGDFARLLGVVLFDLVEGDQSGRAGVKEGLVGVAKTCVSSASSCADSLAIVAESGERLLSAAPACGLATWRNPTLAFSSLLRSSRRAVAIAASRAERCAALSPSCGEGALFCRRPTSILSEIASGSRWVLTVASLMLPISCCSMPMWCSRCSTGR
ncbi:MAG: HEAT repeat domain-containing protein, partial [Planctomycetota bacterium]